MNTNKLKGKIVECGLNAEKVAELMGIHHTTMLRKLKFGSFLIDEALKLQTILSLTEEEAIDIFLR